MTNNKLHTSHPYVITIYWKQIPIIVFHIFNILKGRNARLRPERNNAYNRSSKKVIEE